MFSKNGSAVVVLLSCLTISFINNGCHGKPTPDPELDLPRNVTEGEGGGSPAGAGDSPVMGSGATESDDPALECILDMITVMASGDEGDLSDSCKLMLGGMQETLQGVQTASTSAPSTQATLADLQSQLRDLTESRDSKLPDVDDINSDEGSDLLSMKRDEGHAVGHDPSGSDQASSVEMKSDVSKAEDKQEKQNGKDYKASDDVTGEIESPFVTSLKDAADDYLVIPMKYLKKQLASGGQLSINEEPEVTRQEVAEDSRADAGAKSDTMDSVEDALDTDQSSSKQYEWNNPGPQGDERPAEDVFNEERFDALYRVETDLIHLKEDLNHLKLSQRGRVL